MRFLIAYIFTLACLPGHAAPLTQEQQALHVLNRVAYGARPGEVQLVAQMGVRRYLEQQLAPASLAMPQALLERLQELDTPNLGTGAALGEYVELQRDVRDEEDGARQRRRAGLQRMTLETAEARVLRAVESPRQLEEVMVDFWYNHFNVFAGKGIARALVPSYERDAIRPHALGSFRAMLGATARHPAMLYYLDNHLSSAEGAGAGKNKRGLNENYARELMELHTLGVDGGYTQKDVTELARMLTGWTYQQRELIEKEVAFRFEPRRHDRGVKHWLGRSVTNQGEAEGDMALDVLAAHPATARHLSLKLARYFVRDDPPAALVERMARTWQDSKGDIRSVLRTLFASDEFMDPANAGAKFKTPYQYVISAARASDQPLENIGPLLAALNQLGMPLYGCATPDGYKNTEAAWLNPDALTRRIAFASAFGGKADAAKVQAVVGPQLSPRSAAQIAASPATLRAAMLLGSPDFMQR